MCLQDAGYGIVQCLLSLSDAPVAAADAEAAANGGAVMSATFGDVMEPGYSIRLRTVFARADEVFPHFVQHHRIAVVNHQFLQT